MGVSCDPVLGPVPGGPRSTLMRGGRIGPRRMGRRRSVGGSDADLRMHPRDRRCRGSTLDNPLRRWLAPPSRDVERWEILPGLRVLDLGAGVGYFASALLEALGGQGRLLLVEPDPKALARARRRWGGDPRVGFLEAPGSAVPVPDSSQDRVILSLVLCCLRDKAGVLDEAWRVLRPGGRVIVSYPRLRWGPGAHGLQVTPALLTGLLGRHPWKEARPPRGWIVREHQLERTPDRSVEVAVPGEPPGPHAPPPGEPSYGATTPRPSGSSGAGASSGV